MQMLVRCWTLAKNKNASASRMLNFNVDANQMLNFSRK